ncbi:hypothetical protein [Marinoscillum luteum]|uniref:DUF4878 domain-containing protein n=1 Tax=Marinoscillum luteum TaxID=861051 RepID=A0ABW7NCD4_9BACT
MKTCHILCVALIYGIISCGPSKSEIEQRNKFVADSTARVDSIRKESLRIHYEKIEVGKQVKENYLKEILELNKAEILKAEKKLRQINEFQLGRSLSTKEQQIADQRNRISQLERLSSSIQAEIAKTKLFESHEFQSTPEGAVKHLFEASESGNLSKLRNLIDPYGEFTKDVAQIGFIEIFPEDSRSKFREMFKKGRIMGEPKVSNDTAEIEIAYGGSSNRLEVIKLVRRMGKWYFLDF